MAEMKLDNLHENCPTCGGYGRLREAAQAYLEAAEDYRRSSFDIWDDCRHEIRMLDARNKLREALASAPPSPPTLVDEDADPRVR